MARVLLIPVSIVIGLVAGQVTKRALGALWEEPPNPSHQDAPLAGVVAAAALAGAVGMASKAVADRVSRRAVFGLTGSWPGQSDPS